MLSVAASTVPYKIIKLATDLFARETGFSGPEIHEIFADHTDALGPYQGWGGGSASRWQIFQDGLKSMSANKQRSFLIELCSYDGRAAHGLPSPEEIAKFRSMLLSETSPNAYQASSALSGLDDWQIVARSWDAALSKVNDDPDGAITATRTTLESVCKHICEERSAHYEDSWDLAKLYKAAATSMQISPDQHSEQIIKQILSGSVTVVGGIAAMRNALSDAHGRGKRSVGPAPRHAKLAVNAGFAVAVFLVDSHLEKSRIPSEAPATGA